MGVVWVGGQRQRESGVVWGYTPIEIVPVANILEIPIHLRERCYRNSVLLLTSCFTLAISMKILIIMTHFIMALCFMCVCMCVVLWAHDPVPFVMSKCILRKYKSRYTRRTMFTRVLSCRSWIFHVLFAAVRFAAFTRSLPHCANVHTQHTHTACEKNVYVVMWCIYAGTGPNPTLIYNCSVCILCTYIVLLSIQYLCGEHPATMHYNGMYTWA